MDKKDSQRELVVVFDLLANHFLLKALLRSDSGKDRLPNARAVRMELLQTG
jgi:hypothetical protein